MSFKSDITTDDWELYQEPYVVVVVGTEALEAHGIHLREPSDIDIFSDVPCRKWDIIIMPKKVLRLIPEIDGYATPDAVYTIKCSHLGWDIKWDKHKNDVLKLKKLGCKLIPGLYRVLVEYWRKTNGDKEHLSLYKTKKDFFNDAVPYVYDHDYLHKVVAFPNNPVYTLCLKDGQDIAIDKDKFKLLPIEQQLRMFKEEIVVIAAERWLINPKCQGKYHWLKAYNFAVHKIITSLTKGWATDFMIEHLEYFVKPEYSYFKNLVDRKIIMSNEIAEKMEIINEIITAYNNTNPKYPVGLDDVGTMMEVERFGEFEIVDTEGGEDQGSYAHTVFKWKDVYYKLVYSYTSYNGFEFDDIELYEVEPKEKMTIVYE